MVDSSRQAGVHRFDGIYEFEVLRRIAGDAAAEEFLLVDYKLHRGSSRAANVARNGLDLGDRNRHDGGAEPAAGSRS
jgi:hypothetical protein